MKTFKKYFGVVLYALFLIAAIVLSIVVLIQAQLHDNLTMTIVSIVSAIGYFILTIHCIVGIFIIRTEEKHQDEINDLYYRLNLEIHHHKWDNTVNELIKERQEKELKYKNDLVEGQNKNIKHLTNVIDKKNNEINSLQHDNNNKRKRIDELIKTNKEYETQYGKLTEQE